MRLKSGKRNICILGKDDSIISKEFLLFCIIPSIKKGKRYGS